MSNPKHQHDYTNIPDKDAGRINWGEEFALLVVYLCLFAALSWKASPYFLHVRNLLNILVAVSTIGIISIAMTMVIVSGGIDLSIGSVVAITGVAVAHLSHQYSMPVAVIVSILIGTAIGAFNGVLVTFARINPFIVTLATLSIFRGYAMDYSGGLTQSIHASGFDFLGRGYLMGVPFPAVVMLILFAIAAFVMGWTVFGRNIYAIGGNPQASRLASLPVTSLRLTIYILSGFSAALGGIFLTSQLGAAAPQAAQGLELSVIAAVILGGTSLTGGKGTIWGTLLGVLIMGTLNNGLTLLNVPSAMQDVSRGTVLLLAAGLDQIRQWYSSEH